MRRSIAFLFMLATLSGMCKQVLGESVPTLKITIQAEQISVKDGDIFPVTTLIQNVGKDIQTLHLWSCSYDKHWMTDNAKVKVLEISCDKNFLQEVQLKPGESQKRELNLRADVAPKNPPMEMPSVKSVSFRLGFTDGHDDENKTSAQSIWSNSVTLKVAK